MNTRRVWFVLVALVLVIATMQPVFAASHQAPLFKAEAGQKIPDRYIVVFKDDVSDDVVEAAVAEVTRGHSAVTHYRYTSVVKGFAGTMPASAVAALRNNPNVAYIEEDQVVTIDASQSPATWGLDRIDQHNLPLNNSYTYNYTGSGVTAYIVDTGIRTSHSEFGGRASIGTDTVGDGQNGVDCNGHGTHVAGTVGGATYGVAKSVSLVAVRVLDCGGSGTISGVVAGVDWVGNNAKKPAVANMSLGGSASTTLDNAVKGAISKGVTFAVAAGNEKVDACRKSPARVPEALTVGATTSTDARASYSNYGSCLDLFAPGSSITSAWYTSNTATNTISGTSMATPHVTGVAALYLQANPSASPAAVSSAITSAATPNVVGNPGRNSPNRLLYSLIP